MPSKEYMKEYRRKNNPKLKEKEDLAKESKNKKIAERKNTIKVNFFNFEISI